MINFSQFFYFPHTPQMLERTLERSSQVYMNLKNSLQRAGADDSESIFRIFFYGYLRGDKILEIFRGVENIDFDPKINLLSVFAAF